VVQNGAPILLGPSLLKRQRKPQRFKRGEADIIDRVFNVPKATFEET
jgi:hypothetical protein